MSNKRQLRYTDGEVLHGLESELHFDQKTMKGTAKYLLNGVECPQIKLDTPQAKMFSNYALIKKDLKFCKQALKIAISLSNTKDEMKGSKIFRPEFDEKSDVLKGMYISFVVTYGKCFTKADGRRVKLEVKDFFEEDIFKKSHLSVMSQRHEYIAHGGKTAFEQVEPVVILHPNIEEKVVPMLTTQSFHLVGFNSEQFESYLELVNHVDETLDEILQKKATSLFQKEIEGFTLEELYKIART